MTETEILEYANLDESSITAYKGIYNRYIKRALDFVFAFIFFIILIPFYLIISLAVAVDSGLPVLYRAERGGYRGKNFKICKFRSMVNGADKIGGCTTALNDSRITRIGGILRKTKFDETPQLINILKGEMSFVGPRPEVLKYVEAFEGTEKLISEVRPGITDYSSLQFINLDEIVGAENADEVFETKILKQKNALRIKYVSEVSFFTDIKIFFLTVWGVVKKILRIK